MNLSKEGSHDDSGSIGVCGMPPLSASGPDRIHEVR